MFIIIDGILAERQPSKNFKFCFKNLYNKTYFYLSDYELPYVYTYREIQDKFPEYLI